MLLYRYLSDYDNDTHIQKIINVYSRQRDAMVEAIADYFPSGVEYTRPQGGMFLWVKLPGNLSSMELFNIAIKKQVAFVPGDPFYVDSRDSYPTLRLNFSCSDVETIDTGICRLGKSIRELMI
jgi:2-aminoadipate transaminase